MKELTCVVIGGGYAGIHAIKAIQMEMRRNHHLRIILIDKKPHHMRNVNPLSMMVSFLIETIQLQRNL